MKDDIAKGSRCYTRGGDQGETRLLSGERVRKSDPRIEVSGVIDELNSTIGAFAAVMPAGASNMAAEIKNIQTQLFHIGAWLSASSDSPVTRSLKGISQNDILALEESINEMESKLPPLKRFILPGGHPSAATAQVARTICRKAERRLTRLADTLERDNKPAPPGVILVYLNRLSDYLFVTARYCNMLEGVAESPVD